MNCTTLGHRDFGDFRVCLGARNGAGDACRRLDLAPAARPDLAQRHGLTPDRLVPGFVAATVIGAATPEQLRKDIAGGEARLSGGLLQDAEALRLRHFDPVP